YLFPVICYLYILSLHDALPIYAIGYNFVINNMDILKEDNFSMHVSSRKPFGLDTSFNKNLSENIIELNNPVKCYANNGRTGFIEKDSVSKGFESINKWKVLTTRANNVGTELNDDNVNTIISEPESVCTETFLTVGTDLNLNRHSAKNISN